MNLPNRTTQVPIRLSRSLRLLRSPNTTGIRTEQKSPVADGRTNNGVCDPTQGFHYDQNTIDNFGKINIKRGHRVIEFALKYYF